MDTTWQQLEGAALVLARSSSIKDRLAEAYREHLARVNPEEIPEALRAQFRACLEALTRERPQRGEDAVRATVRKMSNLEADEIACSLVRLYGALVRESLRPSDATLLMAVPTPPAASGRTKKAAPQIIAHFAQEA
jgi:hypothetical protein